MMTLIDILRLSSEYLTKHGIPDARRNAELLASHVLAKSRLELYLEHDRPLQEDEIGQMRSALAQRKARKPIQYIFGEAEFFGLPFRVNSSVLIPRPETELLVEEALKTLGEIKLERAIVYDIGTGSGCIAVSIAKNAANCTIYASDVSTEALKTASENATENGVEGQIEFLLGPDLRSFTEVSVPKADLIVANPPYVSTVDWERLEPEVRDYEPRRALDGGPDGLEVIRRIIDGVPAVMNPGGTFLLEIGIGQSGAVISCMNANGRFRKPRIREDYQGIDRVIIAKSNHQAQ